MCEMTAYLLDGKTKTIILDDVAKVSLEGDLATVLSMTGERKLVEKVRVKLVDQSAHAIFLERC